MSVGHDVQFSMMMSSNLRFTGFDSRRFPVSFRKVLTEFSSNFKLHWSFPDERRLPGDLSGIIGGHVHWGPSVMEENEALKRS